MSAIIQFPLMKIPHFYSNLDDLQAIKKCCSCFLEIMRYKICLDNLKTLILLQILQKIQKIKPKTLHLKISDAHGVKNINFRTNFHRIRSNITLVSSPT